ncbi:protein-disulfide reductase DsbD [Alloalcanivorax xenomutans]|uniref:Protein-disulfide reductase DsbD n=1 Tax=Alloalcanivorax xenomutans TaxID=1094342 RepID=A0A9Q3W1W0_9GAMM|nr:protein-disulfide reductase DsbD [Alloalcanivorax xenomutans]ARB44840.1 disulfide bond formation protein DsbD [Alloalcanivorax xenomutans]MCE7507055.1 protein-disulfide reductase DsbD [Alloalcanivorax xenomutans]WOD29427.1 protein-disulfide reductase DsbD [Alloalcanivorax xenomutans]
MSQRLRSLLSLFVLGLLASPALALSLGGGSSGGLGNDQPPTVDEAIQVMADADWDKQTVLVGFELLDDVYLYRQRFEFILRDTNGNVLDDFSGFQMPAGKPKVDPIFGDVEVFYQRLEVSLPLRSVPLADTELEVRYQGCIEDLLCYPPASKTFAFEEPRPGKPPTALSATAPAATPTAAASTGDGGFLETLFSEDANAFNRWISGQSLGLVIALFFAGGLLLAFTPCVFPMIPILSGIIAGEQHPSARRGFLLSSAYVLGVAVPYTLAGLLVALFGAGLNLQFLLQQPAAIITSVVIFVLLALAMFGLYELQLPAALRDRLNQTGPKRKGLAGAALLGMISALVVSPCVTPILAGALIYVAGSGDALTGAASLFALSIGMGVPLILFGTGGGHLLPRAGLWMEEIKRFFGVVMLGVAIWLLDRIVPAPVTLALYGLLLAIYGVQLGALEPVKEGGSRLKRGLALVLTLYGVILLIGAASGARDPWQPLAHWQQPAAPVAVTTGTAQPMAAKEDHGPWRTLTGQAALRQALAESSRAGRPVLVDFFAEWCVACKVLEETTLSHPDVLATMEGFDLYRVDITDINSENQAIMTEYDIFGLPSLVFFTPAGEEVPESRVLGEMGPERFIRHLEQTVLPVTAS